MTPICEPTCARDGMCDVCEGPQVLHNMSVPSTSWITVARTLFPGLRFAVRLSPSSGTSLGHLRDRLAKGGWRAARTLLEARDDAPWTAGSRPPRPEDLERHLRQSLAEAGVPDRLGVFLDEEDGASRHTRPLPPAATLAVLARRSGALYLPSRRIEVSLADPRRPAVLFFPEEPR